MIEKIRLASVLDENLLLAFVARAKPVDADRLLVEFAESEMRERLKNSREREYSGWNTAQCENSNLKARLLKNVESGDWVDVLNLAAMLLARERMFEEVHYDEA